jgi:competence protein ComEC
LIITVHVVIIAGAIVFVLSACGLCRTRWALLLGPALIVYTIMTGFQPSAVRACIMGVAYAAAPLCHRRADLHTSLALAALLILAVNPGDLANAGFILSFVAVLGLGLFYPVFAEPLRRRLMVDPLQLQPEPRWKALGRAGLHHVTGLIAMSLAAWIATTPLTAWYFGLFSPIALPGNLAAVPLASLIIITGLIALVTGNFALGLAAVFNHANLVLATLLAGSIRLLNAIPFGHIQVPAPTILAMIAWYALLILWRFKIWVDAPQPIESQSPSTGGEPRLS